MQYDIETPDGRLTIETKRAIFDGDSPLVEPLDMLTADRFVPTDEGPVGISTWSGAGPVRLALETVEPRLRHAWRDLLPPAIREAIRPVLSHEPTPFGVDE